LGHEADLFDSHHDYAQSLGDKLHKAYEFARVKQHEAAFINAEARDKKRSDVEFTKGDRVFYWMDKSSEKIAETDIGRITIPGKWRSWWQGPYEILSKKTQNLYEILISNKPVIANVNRLTPHDSWSDTVEDTNEVSWLDGPLGNLGQFTPFISQTKGPSSRTKVGSMVCWHQSPTATSPLNFGVGKVLSAHVDEKTKREKLICQFYGNATDNAKGTYRPCWYKKNTRQFYYSGSRQHKSHEQDTTDDWSMDIFSDELIMQNFAIRHDDRLEVEDLARLPPKAESINMN
jgi:hypothetical protein